MHATQQVLVSGRVILECLLKLNNNLYFAVIMEKLLRCCDINTLYILIRSKKGKNIDTRCDEIFDDAVCKELFSSSTKRLTLCIPYDRFSIN